MEDTYNGVLYEIKVTGKINDTYGGMAAASRLVGVANFAEAYYGTDIYSHEEVDAVEKVASGSGRLGSILLSATGPAKLLTTTRAVRATGKVRFIPDDPPKAVVFNLGKRTTELAEKSLIEKLKKRGYSVDQSPAIQRYLDMRDANAATFMQKDILLRPDPRKIEVLEEYLHNVQGKIGINAKMTPTQLEVHVKDFMLRHKKILGINADDAAWLKNWLDTVSLE